MEEQIKPRPPILPGNVIVLPKSGRRAVLRQIRRSGSGGDG